MSSNFEQINRLMKEMVIRDEEFRRAQVVVAERKKIQEALKELFKMEGITQHILNEDGYSAVLNFKIGKMHRVDVMALPKELKDLYMKVSDVWREMLVIMATPN